MYFDLKSLLFMANWATVAFGALTVENNEQLILEKKESKRFNEYVIPPGHDLDNDHFSPLPHTYVDFKKLPKNFNWGNIDGYSYLTKNLNQHIPQYCGSCWAHGAASALADRIKIARKGRGIEINLSIQFILNCGTEVAGSCHGGSHLGVYNFIKNKAGHIPFDTCLGYEACSSESSEGFCGQRDWSCSKYNTCRTCSTFDASGGFCSEIDTYPNATIAEYGTVSGEKKMMAEIYKRGSIACGVDADFLDNYEGGIIDNVDGREINHIISIVGWGEDSKTGKPYWLVRNSWGEYWGEMGYFRAVRGKNMLMLEEDCAWAVPKTWTNNNFPCHEDGGNCVKK